MLAKTLKRLRRKNRIRAKISGTSEKPRLSVFRSNSFISVQLIDDTKWITLASASDLKIEGIVFDRGWFIYHWRVKALAEALREGGIKF